MSSVITKLCGAHKPKQSAGMTQFQKLNWLNLPLGENLKTFPFSGNLRIRVHYVDEPMIVYLFRLKVSCSIIYGIRTNSVLA